MNFDYLSKRYIDTFGEMPPVLTTLDTEDEMYLDVLYRAIISENPLTRNDLAEIFMKDDKAVY